MVPCDPQAILRDRHAGGFLVPPHDRNSGNSRWILQLRCGASNDEINSGEIERFIDLLTEDFIEHEQMPGMPTGRDGTRQLFTMIATAFPDMNWNPEHIRVDGDKAVARTRFSGTNDGELMGMPASGTSVSVQLSTSSGSAMTASPANTGACWT